MLRVLRDSLNAPGVHTLTGPPGVGKTRLAQELTRDFDSPTYFCGLTQARNEEGVVRAIGRSVGIRLRGAEGTKGIASAVARKLDDDSNALVVLDGFDEWIGQATELLDWMLASSGRYLVTSREVLGFAAEQVHEVGPLSTTFSPPDERSDAARFFVAQVVRRRGAYEPGERELEAIERVCIQLDGLPLALELAAGRMRAMDAVQLESELRDRFSLLVESRAQSPRTLLRAIEASWERLPPWEQAAIGQCAVFPGGFDLEAMAQVVRLDAWPDAPPIIDVMTSLRNRSLLQMEAPVARLRLLRSIRDFMLRKIDPRDLEATRDRFTTHYLERMQPISDRVDTHDFSGLPELISNEDNLQEVVQRGLQDNGDAAFFDALRALRVLAPLQWAEGSNETQRRQLRRALEMADQRVVPSELVVSTAYTWARIERQRGNSTLAVELANRAVDSAVDVAPLHVGHAHRTRGLLHLSSGEMANAAASLRSACEAFEHAGETLWVAITSSALGQALTGLGEHRSAVTTLANALELGGAPSLRAP